MSFHFFLFYPFLLILVVWVDILGVGQHTDYV